MKFHSAIAALSLLFAGLTVPAFAEDARPQNETKCCQKAGCCDDCCSEKSCCKDGCCDDAANCCADGGCKAEAKSCEAKSCKA